MSIRRPLLAFAVATPLALATACSGDGDDGGLTAEKVVERLAEHLGEEEIGEPRDSTATCSNEAAGGDPQDGDCAQLIVTGQVSVYEFPTAELSREWVNRFGGVDEEDWRQAGRFAVVWSTPEQLDVGEPRRDEIAGLVAEWAAETPS
ncbi:hypothetical protein [Streptomyces aidingensis]|uniref:Lipoprotein n=1 Tax=Streptomyces aidingensis TaxID=910347 RepID=A0A1I1FTV1_9ACTN|nr:hypothetical protein [Streptomyces aidingensis]SFC02867.1 hypothetical protein SAMN05421773_101872 [Streptomyces aidingensis]